MNASIEMIITPSNNKLKPVLTFTFTQKYFKYLKGKDNEINA